MPKSIEIICINSTNPSISCIAYTNRIEGNLESISGTGDTLGEGGNPSQSEITHTITHSHTSEYLEISPMSLELGWKLENPEKTQGIHI